MLRIEHFTKKYGEKKAVDDLSLGVGNGQICAFIGHNGAGKTTTLKAIAGILDYDQGEIEVDGIDISKNPIEAKKQIAYLPDNPELYEHLKGVEYLNFVADVFSMSKEERREQIEKLSKRLEIFDSLNDVIETYSHGMKQKLALVSALMHKPKLLLLDEPFVGLDPMCAHEVKEIMREMAQNGATIFYSTHVLEVAEKICSSVAIIKQGKLIAFDTMDNIKGSQSLESIYLELENEKHS